MKKLIGHKRKNTCIFISGTGTNLKSLIKFSKKKISPISINLVISNKKAKGLRFAKKYKIKNKIINFSSSKKAEKSIELTKALVLMGYQTWSALEPGKLLSHPPNPPIYIYILFYH